MFQTFREMLDPWTRAGLAEAMGTVSANQVAKWYERDFIPVENWQRFIEVSYKSQAKRLALMQNLVALAEKRRAAA